MPASHCGPCLPPEIRRAREWKPYSDAAGLDDCAVAATRDRIKKIAAETVRSMIAMELTPP